MLINRFISSYRRVRLAYPVGPMSLRLRTSTSRRGDTVYRYYQLTRAVRRDGKPTHEVVAHLGRLPDHEAEAIRNALVALSGSGAAAAAAPQRVPLDEVVGRAALRYLDVMVVHRLWQRWGFRKFFENCLPSARSVIAPADVVEVLVVNRCLAPCSKLRVTEWTPRTVLPHLPPVSGKLPPEPGRLKGPTEISPEIAQGARPRTRSELPSGLEGQNGETAHRALRDECERAREGSRDQPGDTVAMAA